MPYVITDACVDIMDRSCVDHCPVDCIQQGERMFYINPDDCIDCGACEPACPREAIHLAEALPADLHAYTAINAEFSAGTAGGPAGGREGRSSAVDHPVVAAPPRER
jgi:NAD-dependent dihydropyrimidine dehydrogenase PreA subunit